MGLAFMRASETPGARAAALGAWLMPTAQARRVARGAAQWRSPADGISAATPQQENAVLNGGRLRAVG